MGGNFGWEELWKKSWDIPVFWEKGLGMVACGVVEGGPIWFPTESSLIF